MIVNRISCITEFPIYKYLNDSNFKKGGVMPVENSISNLKQRLLQVCEEVGVSKLVIERFFEFFSSVGRDD